jgi:PAS domain S-box-containing protein
MKAPLRVLLVEDSEDDAHLLLRNLERSDYQIVHQRVETAEALTSALDQQSWDFLFCDYTLPHFSGQRALEIVRKRDLDLPFIFVSGTLGEDVAVQAMRAGAQDYVMKNNLTRLVPAMKRELGEANVRRQRREAEEEMRSSEYKYRNLFESLSDAAFLIDADSGQIFDTNSRAEALLGRTNAEILSMRKEELYPLQNSLRLSPAEAPNQTFEATILRRDGKVVPVRVSLSKFDLHNRKVLSALFHDISDSKESAKKIQEQANLLELAHDAIFVHTLDEKIQYWNKGAQHLYGWTAEEASNGDFGKIGYEDRASFEAAKKILLEEGRWSGEVSKRTKTRQDVVVASSWTLVRDGAGNPTSVLVIARRYPGRQCVRSGKSGWQPVHGSSTGCHHSKRPQR